MMKLYLLYLITYLMMPFMSCNAQNNKTIIVDSFIKRIEKEIDTSNISIDIFSDKVSFEIKGKNEEVSSIKQKENNWKKVKNLFTGTDYVVKEASNVNEIGEKSYELKNHKYFFIIGVNNQHKIFSVKEVESKLPSDAPPVNRH